MSPRLIIAKIFSLIVAVQILNMSIYTCEFEEINQTQTTSQGIDETDSFVELIAENVIAHENIDKNTGNNSGKETHYFKDVQLKLYPPADAGILLKSPVAKTEFYSSYILSYSFLFFKEFNPPPSSIVQA